MNHAPLRLPPRPWYYFRPGEGMVEIDSSPSGAAPHSRRLKCVAYQHFAGLECTVWVDVESRYPTDLEVVGCLGWPTSLESFNARNPGGVH